MRSLEGRVAIITGGGRGLGREHAPLFASEGAKVVVNDLGGSPDGKGVDAGPAQEVVDEIVKAGGDAVANRDDVATWDGGQRLLETALNAFGDVHALINNAGILRDRMLTNMSESEWDDVITVHLKGHFCPTRAVAAYWKEQFKGGSKIDRSIVNTTSTSGLFAMAGQSNYGTAKSGLATLGIIAQKELGRWGVRVNSIAPMARTRLTLQTPGTGEALQQRAEEAAESDAFDELHPGNVSPFVAYLATADCPIKGRVFIVWGGQVHLVQPWKAVDSLVNSSRWTVEGLASQAARFAEVSVNQRNPFSL